VGRRGRDNVVEHKRFQRLNPFDFETTWVAGRFAGALNQTTDGPRTWNRVDTSGVAMSAIFLKRGSDEETTCSSSLSPILVFRRLSTWLVAKRSQS
jgi:hypothetical protein